MRLCWWFVTDKTDSAIYGTCQKLYVQRKIDEPLLDAVMTRRRFGREAITAMRMADTAAPRQGNGDG